MGQLLMADGFPMDWSEKHISFTFTLKADTQLGRGGRVVRGQEMFSIPSHTFSSTQTLFDQRLLICH